MDFLRRPDGDALVLRQDGPPFPNNIAKGCFSELPLVLGPGSTSRSISTVVAGMAQNQPVRLRASSILASRLLRGHLVSDVDRPQERLIVICKDEGASRVAITRGLVVRS